MNPDPNRQRESEDGERVVVRDRRRIDPETGAVRTPDGEQPSGAAPAAEPEVDDPRVAELTGEVAERTADLQRLSAEYANYRRRVDRDREAVQHESAEVSGPTVTVVSSVMRRGYRIGDRVLRPAMVGVVDRADDGTAIETPPDGIPVADPENS